MLEGRRSPRGGAGEISSLGDPLRGPGALTSEQVMLFRCSPRSGGLVPLGQRAGSWADERSRSSALRSRWSSSIYNLMVVDQADVDQLFHALADPTRRDIVRRTLSEQSSVSILAREYPMSFAAVQKHVAVLERAGLVTKQRRGREQLVAGNPASLRAAHDALDRLELIWRDRVARMDDLLASDSSA
jgi:DNA-binding transcriptional ArsR family regulator